MRNIPYQKQQNITAEEALKLLKEGNKRFLDHHFIHRDFEEQRQETSEAQYPFAVILSCIDSRMPTEIIFDQGIGDIFNIRMPGNIINKDVLGSLEFACRLSGTPLIVVMGHTSCGAVKGACDHVKLGNLTGLLTKIEPAIAAVQTAPGVLRNSENQDFVNEVAKVNVKVAMDEISKGSKILDAMIQTQEVKLVGAMYDLESGAVDFDLPF
ncbi:MAG: carbonic anhydrase [Bacteroidales bacterium]|nr:carbonic anhydrase [Bacteroidales bacterium]